MEKLLIIPDWGKTTESLKKITILKRIIMIEIKKTGQKKHRALLHLLPLNCYKRL